MVSFPVVQIQTQNAKLGIVANRGVLDFEQPRATMEIKTTPPKLNINSENGELHIDQSRAWDAYGTGGHLKMMNSIYQEARRVGMEGIARIVDEGNRMAAIQNKADAFVELAHFAPIRFNEFNYCGDASFDNVDINYIAHKPDIQVQDGQLSIETQVNKPIMNNRSGILDIYMIQYQQIQFTPPQIDVMK
ncbi:DUF6470 family protein [Paenibacillus sp. N1-5-1-14]|uniref:DUF6470 family protein n=1 Tax=Paenibacillus radicibacter TaxID=2972488 RepID=UPI002159452B|nr:DUF6470 family protein [Paenibacillus radicibacter]MCR8645041.1 DUF6470 family protein [Paenibacillus radicibacter]